METLNTKIEKLRSIATSLNLYGESVDAIIQMLGYVLHSSEVEHIAYSQEASLERATNLNSKIQHCVEMMYSVYRGNNPRVIISFTPQKRFQFNPGDLVSKSNNYNIYYLGYWDDLGGYSKESGDFVYSGTTIYPSSDTKTIICLLSKNEIIDTWKIDVKNLIYHNVVSQDNPLSSDYFLGIGDSEGGVFNQVEVTRQFSDQTRKNYFFDLTLPGMGMRIYYPNSYKDIVSRQGFSDKYMKIKVHEYITLDSINPNELKNLKIQGGILSQTPENIQNKFNSQDYIIFDGLIFIKESGVDGLESIHFLANQNRYSGTMLSVNQDLSFLLAEAFPNKIRQIGGVSYKFDSERNALILYYIPNNSSLDLTETEKQRFKEENSSYFITKNIEILRGKRYNVKVVLNVDLYSNTTLTSEIEKILDNYQFKFGISLEKDSPCYNEILSLITKLQEVKFISKVDLEVTDPDTGEILDSTSGISTNNSYYSISCEINSTVS